jgi:heat shock protein HslJ
MKTTSLLVTALVTLIATACADTPVTPASSSPEAASPSVIGEWKLVAYGNASNTTPALPGVETSIRFDENVKFNGTVGCNSLGGDYKLDGDRITFNAIFTTRMACPGIMDQEYGVLGILSESRLTITFDGNQMALTSEDGASVVIFSRK